MDAATLSIVKLEDRTRLKELYEEFNRVRDEKLAACGSDHTTLAYEAIDLDIGALLLQLLPILADFLTKGFTLSSVLLLAKVAVSLFLKDSELGAILLQIIELLLKGFVI